MIRAGQRLKQHQDAAADVNRIFRSIRSHAAQFLLKFFVHFALSFFVDNLVKSGRGTCAGSNGTIYITGAHNQEGDKNGRGG